MMAKHIAAVGVVLIFFFVCLPVHAIDLHFDTGKTYGVTRQSVLIEVPTDNSVSPQEVYGLFSSSRPFLKLTKPDSSYPGTAAFALYDSFASGWYLTLPPDNSTYDTLAAFTGRTSRPVVAEITPYNAAFITSLHSRFPQVRIHTARFLYWPRSDVKALLGQTPPPTIEAVSIRLKENSQSDLFVTFKAIFDTIFDASNDVEAGSGIKINYPPHTLISVSDITPEWSADVKNVAFRFGVAGGAVVTYLQDQGKSAAAPVQYIGLGKYAAMSGNGRAIAARFAKFISLQPNIIWPMAMAGNGDPYDNTFFQESNSKPVVGVIGLIQNAPEGVVVNTSGETVSVSVPGNPDSAAYSSITGSYRFGRTIQMSPWETVIFGSHTGNISASAPPPTAAPTVPPPASPPPTAPPALSSPTPAPLATAPPQAPSPTIQYFPIGGPAAPSPAPVPGNPSAVQLKHSLRLFIIRTDPLFRSAGSLAIALKQYDVQLEEAVNMSIKRLVALVAGRFLSP